MIMSLDLRTSLSYPQKDESVWMKTGIGAVTLAFVLPVFLTLGYYMRVIAGGMKASERLPEWNDFGKMLIQGVSAFAVYLAYLLPAAMIGAVSFIPAMFKRGAAFGAGSLIYTFLALGALVLFLAGMALVPMALARYEATGKLVSAFQIKELVEQIKAAFGDYVVMSVVMLVAFGGITVVGNWIAKLPFYIGNIITLAAVFYVSLIVFNWTGAIYRTHFLKPEEEQVGGIALAAPEAPSPELRKIREDETYWA